MGVIGAYNIVWALSCQGGCRVRFLQVYMVRSSVLWFDLCALPYFLRSFPGPYRAGIPGRLIPVDSDRAGRSWKRRWARPSGRRGRPEAGWRPKRALRSERRAGVGSGCHSSSARPFARRLDRPFGLSFRYLGRPMSCALSAWAEPLLESQSTRDPKFMSPIDRHFFELAESPCQLSSLGGKIFVVD